MSINLVQRLDIETDALVILNHYIKIGMQTVLSSHEEIALKIVDYREKESGEFFSQKFYDAKDHLPIILIGGWYLPKEGKKHSYFDGHDPSVIFPNDQKENAIDAALEHIGIVMGNRMGEWESQFWKKCGEGEDIDGSVGAGYKLKTYGGFPEELVISLTHIYYGK